MLEKTHKETRQKMDKVLEVIVRDFSRIRTGRASPALLEGVMVECYGSSSHLNQVASITVPASDVMIVQPWDNSILKDIERAIHMSNLGLNPSNDGRVLRLPIPPLTSERRESIAKEIRKIAENCRVAIRNIRRETNEELKKLFKDSDITEDQYHLALEQIQEETNQYIEKIDKILTTKEKEILKL